MVSGHKSCVLNYMTWVLENFVIILKCHSYNEVWQLLQCEAEHYYKVWQVLQIATFITKWDETDDNKNKCQ